MRCLTACFRTNHKKIIIKPCTSSTNNNINTISPQALRDLLETHENGQVSVAINVKKEDARHKIANPINLFEEFKDEEEEELNGSSKKNLLETRENGEASVAIDVTKEESKDKEEEKFNLDVSVYDEFLLANHVSANYSNPSNLRKQKGEKEEEETKELSNSSASSYISYPQNHRYHCCRNNSNDEFEDIDLEDDGDVEFSGNELMIQEESSSYESLFSLSIDSTRKGNNPNPMPEMSDKEEVNSPLKQSIKDRNISQLSILNHIRNPSLLKDTAAITTPPSILKKAKQQEEKENVDMNLLDFSITTCNRVQEEPNLKFQERKIAVDTSLSSWLVESSQNDEPNSKNSDGSVGNSPSERRRNTCR